MNDNSYEQQKADLKRKIAVLPKWRQDMYFAKLRQLGLVSITEEEKIQSMQEGEQYLKDEPKCPKCDASEWHRLISLGSFRLQGGGWFRDGY